MNITTSFDLNQYKQALKNQIILLKNQGLIVTVCNGKAPVGKAWQERYPKATTQNLLDTLDYAFKRAGEPGLEPGEFYGLPTIGVMNHLSGIVAIDLDPKNWKNKNGYTIDHYEYWLEVLTSRWDAFDGDYIVEQTPTIVMPENGSIAPVGIKSMRLFFKNREGCPNGDVLPGVDFRSGNRERGAHCLVSPSRVLNGNAYETLMGDWSNLSTLPTLPDELFDLACKLKGNPEKRGPGRPSLAVKSNWHEIRNIKERSTEEVAELFAKSIKGICSGGGYYNQRLAIAFAGADFANRRGDTSKDSPIFKVVQAWYKENLGHPDREAEDYLYKKFWCEHRPNSQNPITLLSIFGKAYEAKRITKDEWLSVCGGEDDREDWRVADPSDQVARVVENEVKSGRYWIKSGPHELLLLDVSTGRGFVCVAQSLPQYDTMLNRIAWQNGMATATTKSAVKAALETSLDLWWQKYLGTEISYEMAPKNSWVNYQAARAFAEDHKLVSLPEDGQGCVWVQSDQGLLNCTTGTMYDFNPYFFPKRTLKVTLLSGNDDADDFLLTWIRRWTKDEETAKKILEVKREMLATIFISKAVKYCEFFLGHKNIGKSFYHVMTREFFGDRAISSLSRAAFLERKWPEDIHKALLVVVDEALGGEREDEAIIEILKNKVNVGDVKHLDLKYAGSRNYNFTPTWVITGNRYSKEFFDPAIQQRSILVEGVEKEEEGTLFAANMYADIESSDHLRSRLLRSILKARVFGKTDNRLDLMTSVLEELRSERAEVRSELMGEKTPLRDFVFKVLKQGEETITTKYLFEIYKIYLDEGFANRRLSYNEMNELKRSGNSYQAFSTNLAATFKHSGVEAQRAENLIDPKDGKRVRGWSGISLSDEGISLSLKVRERSYLDDTSVIEN